MANRRAVLFLTLVLVLLLLNIPYAYSSETNENEELYEFLSSESPSNAKLFDFLSNVIELDLTKYGVIPPEVLPPGFEGLTPLEFYKKISEQLSTLPPVNFTRDDPFGGLVEEECPSFNFAYNNSKFDVMSIFYNGHMNFLDIDSFDEEDYIYSETQPTDTLDRVKGILQRYHTFFQKNYGKKASYLVPMLDILNSINDLSPTEFSEGNVTFQVSKDGNETRIKWIYTEDDVVMDWKMVDIDFRYGAFESFHDTWGLYSVSGLSEISSEEAVQIALEAAQNYEFRIVYENGSIKTVKVPDLSNSPYDVNMYMVPFRYNEHNFPSKIERDPLTLYPLWQLHFYFNEKIGGNEGMQVGIWGDTSEIVYCSGFGYYDSSPPTEQDTFTQTIDEKSPEESLEEQNQPNTLNLLTLGVIVGLVAIPVISISVIVFKRKNENN